MERRHVQNKFMYLHEDTRKIAKKNRRLRNTKIYITAILVTVAIIYIQARFGQWTSKFIGIHISFMQATVIVVITNIVFGFIQGLGLYGKIKKTIKKSEGR